MIPTGAIHVLPGRGPLRASVLLLHGYMSRAAAHHQDGLPFVGDGIEVVIPDAPGHGSRDDGRQARIGALEESARHAAILDIAREWTGELHWLATRCRERGAVQVAAVGISMGGFTALATLGPSCPFDAVAAVLAAPTLTDHARLTPGRPPVLLGLAGRDEVVRPEPGREFAARYGAELHQYPESGHQMRSEDWSDLWCHVATFLDRHRRGQTR